MRESLDVFLFFLYNNIYKHVRSGCNLCTAMVREIFEFQDSNFLPKMNYNSRKLIYCSKNIL